MRLPIGYEDFSEIIRQELDYVDKTLFIKEIIDHTSKVIVLTRPRRFGKTLNLSMLRYFFAKEINGQLTQGLFDGLKISQLGNEYMKHQGQYPVIFLTLKDIKENTFEKAYASFGKRMSILYTEHQFLLNSGKLYSHEIANYESILNQQATLANMNTALQDLTEYLYRYYQVKPIILLDEYDTPIQQAYVHGYYQEMVHFLRNFLGSALKTNDFLGRAIITGILRIAKESLFSELNNIMIYSILDTRYGQYFGFMEEEVSDLLRKSGLSLPLEKIKHWYNGYQMGESVVYNPWSILNCLTKKGRLQPYWINVSSNYLIQEQIAKSSVSVKQDFEQLLRGQLIKKLVDEGTVFTDLKQSEMALWNLLLMSGYLKPVACEWTDEGALCDLAIPNREVKGLYRKIIKQWLSGKEDTQWFVHFLEDLLQGKIKEFEEKLQNMLMQTFSYHDVEERRQELFYHGFILGLLASVSKTHEIKSNRESGLGRYDVMIVPQDKTQLGIILEFKFAENEENLLDLAKLAVQQINEKNYAAELQQRGIQNILRVGIGFNKKEAKIYSE